MKEAYAEIPAVMKAAAIEAEAVLVPQERDAFFETERKLARPKEELCLFDSKAAAKFIDEILKWGQRGFDFLREFDAHSEDHEPKFVTGWSLQRKLGLEHGAEAKDVEEAIQRAFFLGLLVRRTPSPNEADQDPSFHIAKSEEVREFLRERLPESSGNLKLESAQALLSEVFNRTAYEPGLRRFSGYECLSLFADREPFTLTDLFNEPTLYAGNTVQFSRGIRVILESILYEGLQSGLLRVQYRPEGDFYTFTDRGRQLMELMRAKEELKPAS